MARKNEESQQAAIEAAVDEIIRRRDSGRSGAASTDNGGGRDLSLTSIAQLEEKTPEWLVAGYIPKYQISLCAGDGGVGKSTILCSIAAAISSGRPTFLESYLPEGFGTYEPQQVVYFSAEDSLEYTLKRRLRKNGAKLENIFSIDIADDRFQHVKFTDHFLGQILDAYRPALCIFDPIQAFVPPDIHMGDRNAMRNCLAPLIGYGEKYGTTFLIVIHSNKQAGVWGRKRIADSADLWDIARSVLMIGESNEKDIRYLSQEKSNYGLTEKTVLFQIVDEQIRFKGFTEQKDREFVLAHDQQQAPARNDAKEFILEYLAEGEKPVSDLDETAKAMSISTRTLSRAKSELKKDGLIKYRATGQGKEKQFFVSRPSIPA